MTAKNKRRGNDAEYAFLATAKPYGFDTERAWGSDGRSLGLPAEVDCVIGGLHYQVKRKKTAPQYILQLIELIRNGKVHAAAFHFDRKGSWVLLPARDYFALRARAEGRGDEAGLRSVEEDAG